MLVSLQSNDGLPQRNKEILSNIIKNENLFSERILARLQNDRCCTDLCGRVDCEQRDGVHATSRGDVKDHTFGPETKKKKHNKANLRQELCFVSVKLRQQSELQQWQVQVKMIITEASLFTLNFVKSGKTGKNHQFQPCCNNTNLHHRAFLKMWSTDPRAVQKCIFRRVFKPLFFL